MNGYWWMTIVWHDLKPIEGLRGFFLTIVELSIKLNYKRPFLNDRYDIWSYLMLSWYTLSDGIVSRSRRFL